MQMFPSSRLLWLLVPAFLTTCQTIPVTKTSVYLLYDVTEIDFIRQRARFVQEAPERLAALGVDTAGVEPAAVEVSIGLVNDLAQTRMRSARLPAGPANRWDDNPLVRRDAATQFRNTLAIQIDQLLSTADSTTAQSKIYQRLCRELHRLAADSADAKALVLYSDLLENSALFSFYTDDPKNTGIDRFEQDVLAGECLLPDLTGIRIHLVVLRNPEQDDRIEAAAQFWERLLRKKHADVQVYAF